MENNQAKPQQKSYIVVASSVATPDFKTLPAFPTWEEAKEELQKSITTAPMSIYYLLDGMCRKEYRFRQRAEAA
jgi:hypothetical protein